MLYAKVVDAYKVDL